MPTLLAAVAVALGTVAQATTGFGFSLVSAPFLVAVYRAPLGVQLNLVLSVAVNLSLLARDHRHADGRAAAALVAPAAVATIAVGYAVRHSSPGYLTVIAGMVCLVGVAAVASGRRLPLRAGWPATVAVGAVSGAMNVAAGIGGPPVVLFALNAGWPLVRARSTMQVFFLGINAVALVSLGVPGHVPLGLLVGFAGGAAAGPFLARRLPERQVRRATLVMATVGCVLAIGRGLLV